MYLASQLPEKEASKRTTIILFSVVITGGVIVFVMVLGVIFTTILQVSLTNIIGIVSPIAFGILFVISILLIFNVDVGRFLPKRQVSVGKNP